MENLAYAGLSFLQKRQEVARLQHGKKFEYLILESDPTQGYYSKGDFPINKEHLHDHHYYLLVKKPVICFDDKVFRIASKVNEKTDLSLHISPGQMTYNNKNHQCIRIKTDELDHLQLILDNLIDDGINFLKNKNVGQYTSDIQFKKYIEYKQVSKGIFQDNNNENRFFITLPKLIDFDQYLKIIEDIKKNCDFNLFDSFLTFLYYKSKMIDFAGVYSKHCDQARLPEFKDNLDKELKTI